MPGPDTHDVNALAGATYFVVGRGTEGGSSSYHLSITGVTVGTSDPYWGNAQRVVADSGYSLGTLQVDLGKRGTWALGATDGSEPKPGETTYVDGIIDQSSSYAKTHALPYTQDTAQLRNDLLTHGNGEKQRTTLSFIDTDTRDSIDTWASARDGQQWIHKNIDYPQIKNATQSAVDMLDTYGKNIPEDRRLETVAILAKTENQIPSQMKKFETVLKDGGNYEDVLAKANQIKETYAYYDGPKAADLAEHYKRAYDNPEKAAALDRAHTKVGDPNFDPSASASDPDIKAALDAIGRHGRTQGDSGTLRLNSHGDKVTALQTDLAMLGFTDAKDRPLHPDGDFGPSTKAAIEKFQHANAMSVDGIAGPKTLDAVKNAAHPPLLSLADSRSPGNEMYIQALQNIHAIDAERGRTPDHMSDNLPGSLTTAARAGGLTRIDHVALSDDGSRAYAVQGELNSPLKKVSEVDVAQSVAKPLERSSAEFDAITRQPAQHLDAQQQMQSQAQQVESQGIRR